MISIIFLSNLLPLQGGNPLPLFSSEYLLPHRKPDAPLSASLTQHMNHCIRKCLKIPIFPIAGFPRPPWFIRSLPSTDISIITETTGKYNSKNASLLTVYFFRCYPFIVNHISIFTQILYCCREISVFQTIFPAIPKGFKLRWQYFYWVPCTAAALLPRESSPAFHSVILRLHQTVFPKCIYWICWFRKNHWGAMH